MIGSLEFNSATYYRYIAVNLDLLSAPSHLGGLSEDERKVVAHHEMGHAIVAATIPNCDPVQKVSIIPRGVGALGYTIQRPDEDRFLMNKEDLEGRLAVLLGGRAAEKLIFNKISTGASDDIQRATDLARNIVAQYGMDESLGNVAYEKSRQSFITEAFIEKSYSEHTAQLIDQAIQQLVDGALDRASAILSQNESLLREVSTELLKEETLGEEALKPYFDRIQS